MTWFVVRRLIGMLLTLWIVFSVSWLLMRFVPGGPFSSERQLEPEIEANIKRAYQLDLPLYEQYWNQLKRTARFDLGPCYRLAVSERAGLAACAAFDRTIRLHDLASGAVTAVLARHEALVLGLAWADTTLLSGDGAGVVAVWEREPR